MGARTPALELLFEQWNAATCRAADLQRLVRLLEADPSQKPASVVELDRLEREAREAVAMAEAIRLKIEDIGPAAKTWRQSL